jgi:hypothetical protein
MFLDRIPKNFTNQFTKKFTIKPTIKPTIKSAEKFTSADDIESDYQLQTIGITFLIWGCMLFLIMSTPIGNVGENTDRQGLRSLLEFGIFDKKNKVVIWGPAVFIMISMSIVFHSYKNRDEQAIIVAVPFVYIIGMLLFGYAKSLEYSKKQVFIYFISFGLIVSGLVMQFKIRDISVKCKDTAAPIEAAPTEAAPIEAAPTKAA